ncbi:glycosyltransferase family 4 protein [Arenimonas sp.]|uniref:glycosyltransferase family 4 protein n=1 Tax=Arenimonas sp. TaxID=1872635 RepID=UPI0039E5909D
MFTLVVEGWRAYAQSHSIVNQFQCLELLKRGDVRLFHVEAPHPPAGFLKVGSWKVATGLLPAASEAAIAAIPEPPSGLVPDATFRLAFPFDFSSAPRGRTFVFAVAEGKRLNQYMVAGNRALPEVLGNDVTVVTPSGFSRTRLIASGVPAHRAVVVPHGVDTQTFRPSADAERMAQRRKRGIAADDFVFLNVGALYDRKGIPSLLKAFAAIASRHENARLVLKGIDSVYGSRAAVAAMMAKLSAAERRATEGKISYRGGELSYRDLADLYRSADVLVSPYQLEGFNMPVLEAVACGLPVICTAGGPTDDFTRDSFAWRIDSDLVELDGGSERLMPDQDHLVHLMDKSLEDRSFRPRAMATGPAFAAENYAWDKVTDRLVEVLRGR